VRKAINNCSHPMYLQVAFCRSVEMCEGWIDTLANAWRTSGDAQATWRSVMNNVDITEPLWPLAGPTVSLGKLCCVISFVFACWQPSDLGCLT
jgi:hypothetical protein